MWLIPVPIMKSDSLPWSANKRAAFTKNTVRSGRRHSCNIQATCSAHHNTTIWRASYQMRAVGPHATKRLYLLIGFCNSDMEGPRMAPATLTCCDPEIHRNRGPHTQQPITETVQVHMKQTQHTNSMHKTTAEQAKLRAQNTPNPNKEQKTNPTQTPRNKDKNTKQAPKTP